MTVEKNVERLTKALGQLLEKYRTDRNLSRVALAERLGVVGESRIKQLETGVGSLSFNIDIVLAFAKELRTSPSDLLSSLIREAKISSGDLPALQDAFANSIQATSAEETFQAALSKNDDIFGNHFGWSLKMAEMLLRLDDLGKARLEIALRRASPLRSTDEYRERVLFLLNYDLDN